MTATYSMITDSGLNQCNVAGGTGTYIELLYYVPVYDYRIDTLIGPNSSATPDDVYTCTTSADTIPTGEILWNPTSLGLKYNTSTSTKYVLSSVGSTFDSTSITSAYTSALGYINTLDGNALSNGVLSASTLRLSATDWVWTGTNIAEMPRYSAFDGINKENPDVTFMYNDVTYLPVVSSGTLNRAQFTIDITPIGKIKFNKIAVYAVHRDNNISHDPFLFAQVILPTPQVLDGDSDAVTGNVGGLTLTFQLESAAVTNSFENIFYSTSGDYWNRINPIGVPAPGGTPVQMYGLSYPGNVYIANTLKFDDTYAYYNTSADTAISKLFISTFQSINTTTQRDLESKLPQLCLQYVTSSSNSTSPIRYRTTFTTVSGGDCVIDMYNSNIKNTPSFKPYQTNTLSLGTSALRWKNIFSKSIDVTIINPNDTPAAYSGWTRGHYFKIDNDISAVGMDFVVNDWKYGKSAETISTTNKYVLANIKGKDGENLYIRSSVEGSNNNNSIFIIANPGSSSASNSDVATKSTGKSTIQRETIGTSNNIHPGSLLMGGSDVYICTPLSAGNIYLNGKVNFAGDVDFNGSTVTMGTKNNSIDTIYGGTIYVDKLERLYSRSPITVDNIVPKYVNSTYCGDAGRPFGMMSTKEINIAGWTIDKKVAGNLVTLSNNATDILNDTSDDYLHLIRYQKTSTRSAAGSKIISTNNLNGLTKLSRQPFYMEYPTAGTRYDFTLSNCAIRYNLNHNFMELQFKGPTTPGIIGYSVNKIYENFLSVLGFIYNSSFTNSFEASTMVSLTGYRFGTGSYNKIFYMNMFNNTPGDNTRIYSNFSTTKADEIITLRFGLPSPSARIINNSGTYTIPKIVTWSGDGDVSNVENQAGDTTLYDLCYWTQSVANVKDYKWIEEIKG